MSRLDWRDFGADPSGTMDSTQAINDCFQAAIDTGLEVYGPAGEYKITDQLVWSNGQVKLSGSGARTIIKPEGTNYDWLTIGDGTTVGNGPGTGWVRDLVLRGANPVLAPPGSSVGFVINAVRGVEVRNVQVDYAPIGFDLRNNCFGSSFYGCRTIFDRCRIGIDLRGTEIGGGFASGNDIPFFNCWFTGRENGVRMSNGGGYYRFFGGQIGNAGGSSPNDANGSLLMDCTGGTITAAFHSMSFEGASNAWNVRVFGTGGNQVGARLTFDACSFFGKTGAIGVLKITDPYDDSIAFRECGINDTYSAASPLSIPAGPPTARPYFSEVGTYGRPTLNGSLQDLRTNPMLVRAGLTRGFAQQFFWLWFNGLYLRNNGGQLEQSTNGTDWAPV